MPKASDIALAQLIYLWKLQDKIYQKQDPPEQNTWYTLLDDELVRLIYVNMYQTSLEAAAIDVESRWTIDGVVLLGDDSLADDTNVYVHKYCESNLGENPTLELTISETLINSAGYVALIGHEVKLEYRITSIPQTIQVLWAGVNYEKYESI